MPRNMSFMLTTDQMRSRTKTVTRRLGWKFLKVGEVLNACVQCQGLKRGEHPEVICQIRVVSVRSEPLNSISQRDVDREGFPTLTCPEFVTMFSERMKCAEDAIINRIEFDFVAYCNNCGELLTIGVTNAT